jgi:serine/threonine protein kinase
VLSPLEPKDPRVLGPWQLLGTLGSGGFGQVYLGQAPDGRQAAIKRILPVHARDPDFRRRFRREAAAAAMISGRYTAHVLGADVDGPEPWLATAYIPAPSLATWVLEYGPLPADAVLNLAAGLAEALAAIHAVGLVHRDLKPDNVLLAPDGPRVIDFGIARSAGASSLTQAGHVIGTIAYMSPEQLDGVEAGPASDVFSLGSVLVFSATGQPPFAPTGSVGQVAVAIARQPPRLDQVPPQVRPLAAGCLEKDQARRPSPAQILASLRAPATPPPAPASRPEPTVAVSTPGPAPAPAPFPAAQFPPAPVSPAPFRPDPFLADPVSPAPFRQDSFPADPVSPAPFRPGPFPAGPFPADPVSPAPFPAAPFPAAPVSPAPFPVSSAPPSATRYPAVPSQPSAPAPRPSLPRPAPAPRPSLPQPSRPSLPPLPRQSSQPALSRADAARRRRRTHWIVVAVLAALLIIAAVALVAAKSLA